MDDLNFNVRLAMSLEQDSYDFMRCVLQAIDKGRQYRTPFWHASVSLNSSRRWRFMADDDSQPSRAGWSERGSQPSKSASQPIERSERMAVRIDIWEWYQSGEMPTKALIDLSSDAAQKNSLGEASMAGIKMTRSSRSGTVFPQRRS